MALEERRPYISSADLEGLWDDHEEFTQKILEGTRGLVLGHITGQDLTRISEKYLLSIHSEASEVLGNIDWKEHRAMTHPMTRAGLIEELIDIQKYLWGLAMIWGVSLEEFIEAFNQKNYVVNKRWEMEQVELKDPVMVVDIDNVLYKHDNMFQQWLETYQPAMAGVSKRDNALAWEQARHAYRESGAKRYGEAYDENVRMLKQFKGDGWSIVLLTYRPVKVFKNLEYDTLHWLAMNDVPFDKIIWAAYEKYFYMREELQQAKAFIDDELETCEMVSQLGKRVYWVQPGSGTPKKRVEGVWTVNNLWEVYQLEKGEANESSVHVQRS